MAGEYKITIQNKDDATSVFGKGKKAQDFDAGKISRTIEQALTKSMSSMERTISKALIKGTGVDPKSNSNADVINSLNKVSREITNTLKSTVNKSATTEVAIDSKAIATVISTAMEAAMKKHFKTTNTQKPAGSDVKSLVNDIVKKLPSQEVADMSKVVRELSNLNKEISALPRLLASLKSKDKSLDVQALANVLSSAMTKASNSRTHIANASAVGNSGSAVSKDIAAELAKLSGVSANITKEISKISSGANNEIKQLLTKVVTLLSNSVNTYNSKAPTQSIQNKFEAPKLGADIQEFSRVLKGFMSELSKIKSSGGSDNLDKLIKTVSSTAGKVQDVSVTEVKIPQLAKITKSTEALSFLIDALKSMGTVDVAVKVSGAEEAKKVIKDVAGDQEANVAVKVDETKAKKKLADLSRDQVIDIELDVDTKSAHQLGMALDKLKIQADKGIVVGVDSKMLAKMETKLNSLVNNFDYVSASIGEKLEKKLLTLSATEKAIKTGVTAKGDKISPTGKSNLENKVLVELKAEIARLTASLGSLHSVMDRVVDVRDVKEAKTASLDPKSDLITKSVTGSLNNYIKRLESKNVTTEITSKDTRKKHAAALGDAKELSKMIGEMTQALIKNAAASEKLIASNTAATNASMEQWKKRKTEISSNDPRRSTAAYKSLAPTIDIRYVPQTIRPDMSYADKAKSGNEYEAKVYNNMERLARSLDELQKTIYDKATKGLAAKAGDNKFEEWKVVERGGAKEGSQRAFQLQDKQWSMDVVDVKKLASLLGEKSTNMSPQVLLDKYVAKLAQKAPDQKDSLSTGIAGWLKDNVKSDDLSGLRTELRTALGPKLIEALRTDSIKNTPKENLATVFKDVKLPELKVIYANTAGKDAITKQLEDLKRTIAIPAARLTSRGDSVIETTHGSQRSTMQTAKYTTGPEAMFDDFVKKAQANPKVRQGINVGELARAVRTITPNTNKGDQVNLGKDFKTKQDIYSRKTYEDFSRDLIRSKATDIKTGVAAQEDIVNIYKKAVTPISIERQRVTGGTFKTVTNKDGSTDKVSTALSAKKEASNMLSHIDKMASANQGNPEAFMKGMDAVGLSAFKVAKALDSISFDTMYSTIGKTVSSKVEEIVANIATSTGAIGDFEKSIGKLEGLMPIVQPDSPRRGMHQGSTVTTMFNTSKAYTLADDPNSNLLDSYGKKSFKDSLTQEDLSFSLNDQTKKAFITNFNRKANDLFYEAAALSEIKDTDKTQGQKERAAELQIGDNKRLTSLGLPESHASKLADAQDTMKFSGRTLPMYTGNLRELSPFGNQFQQTGRNIGSVSSAKGFNSQLFPSQGLTPEYPNLRSETEDKVIQAGRFGGKGGGYGYNVLAELSHSAGNFEDQILVSGKLAEAVTTAVKKLVLPKADGSGTSKINEGELDSANKAIMSIMGIDRNYKGRADKVKLTDVQNEVSTNRGESVEVQTAKLAELFMNHFGRKLTTRFGSKGVSVTPTSPSTLSDIIAGAKGQKINVMTGEESRAAGLGAAIMPKSIGEMASDILSKPGASRKVERNADLDPKGLAAELAVSGNKFILDIFTDAKKGLVTTDEAEKNSKLFERTKKAFAALDINLEQGVKGIEAISNKHVGPKTTARAIDVRLSSYGAAKRGLQTEPLEMITNNLAGTGNTVIQDDVKYKDLLGRGKEAGSMSKYSKMLGYSGAENSKNDIRARVEKMFSAKQLENEDTVKAIDALVTLEEKSSFYVDVIDEMGNKRKSLVGSKFLSIVEEPIATEAWSKGSIKSHDKGLSLNIPAYAAYSSVFGADSDLMKDVNETFTNKQAEQHDNMLTYLVGRGGKESEDYVKALQKVELADLGEVVKGKSNNFKKGDPKSLLNTVFDTDKYASSYMTSLPSTAGADQEREDFYIPRSISRDTFASPSIAGEYGISGTGRDLQNVVDKGRSLDSFYKAGSGAPDSSLLVESDINSMAKSFGSRVGITLRDTTYGGVDKQGKDQEIEPIKNKLITLLDSMAAEGKLSDEDGSLDPLVKNFFNKSYEGRGGDKYQGKNNQLDFFNHLRDAGKDAKTTFAALKNMLVGTGRPDHVDTSLLDTAMDRTTKLDIMQGTSAAFGNNRMMYEYGGDRGATPDQRFQFQVEKRQSNLGKAKEDYSTAIKKSLVGKSGAIGDTYFTKHISSVLAKATNATVDKTDDLKAFQNVLKAMADQGFGQEVKDLDTLIKDHSTKVDKYKEMGMPVLKQNELGISGKYADNLEANFTKRYDTDTGKLLVESENVSGSLKDLLNYVGEVRKMAASPERQGDARYQDNVQDYVKSELTPYVESARFPFTGTSSLKPYEAKMVTTKDGMGDDVLQVPGVPEMDMGLFEKIYESVQGKVSTLSTEREGLRTEGKDSEADQLTKTIDDLNKAISDVLPKYVAHAQKLDFDGDQIEVHTAKTSAARNDIYKHFKMLTQDIDTTAGKFEDFYAYDAKQPSQGDVPLAFMAKAFTKKFDTDQGYSFMEKPFITENLSYLSDKEKIGILASKEKDTGEAGTDLEAVNKVLATLSSKSGQTLSPVTGVETLGDAAELAAKKLAMIMDKNERAGALVAGYLKEELSNVKMDTAVNAQLFKINTGSDTEGMTRLMRAYENTRGFGSKGDVGMYERNDSSKIGDEFVDKERNTQLNEFFRFAIQKGMDVKHAGERPIAGELIRGVTSGSTGVEKLITSIEENKSYGGLKDFKEVNTESLMNTFGKMTTSQLKERAKSSDIGIKDADSMKRPELIGKMVDNLGFDGFLRDLQQVLETKAKQNAPQVVDKLANNPEAIDKHFRELYATGGPNNGPGNINVNKYITKPEDPLYKFRTDSYQVDEDFDSEFDTARSKIQGTSTRLGAYPEMVRSFTDLNKTSIDRSSLDSIRDQLANNSTDDIASGNISMFDMSDKISAMEGKLGLAKLSDRSLSSSLEDPSGKYKTNAKNVVEGSDTQKADEKFNKRLKDLVELEARINRVVDAADKVPFAISGLLPSIDRSLSPEEPIMKSTSGVRTSSSGTPVKPKSEEGAPNVPGGPGGPGGYASMPGSTSGLVRVSIAQIESGVSLDVNMGGQVKQLINSAAPTGDGYMDSLLSDDPSRYAEEGTDFGQRKDEATGVPSMKAAVNKYASTQQARVEATNASMSFKPAEGTGPDAQLKNIEILREATKALQVGAGVDIDQEFADLKNATTKGLISDASVSGMTNVKEFFDHVQNMAIENNQDPDGEAGMSGKDIAMAWKIYKDAVVGQLINRAKEAKEMYTQMSLSGDDNQRTVAYKKYKASIAALQKRIKSDTGKRGDIYTSNKIWAFPEIAQAGGVYESPIDIQRKTSRDLGNDDDKDSPMLTSVFKNITGDLDGKSRDTMKAPTTKAREAIKQLSGMNEESLKLMQNGRLLERLGPEIAEAWDFEGVTQRITRMREALELFRQYNVSDQPLSVERKNIEDTIKMLKDAENKFSRIDMTRATNKEGGDQWGETGVLAVPKWLDPEQQMNMHKRNLAKLSQYFKKSSDKGGAEVGERYNYKEKVFDDSGEALKSNMVSFHKFKEVVGQSGDKVGLFSKKYEDMSKNMAGANKTIGGAVKRAIAWGTASAIVYGGVSGLKEAIGTLAEIETSMAQLRMVMAPLGSDFEGLQKAAVGFSKEYGTPTTDVLQSMKVFAQQGLSQADITDRTNTSILAGNVTTLKAKDATEALTAAMKIFRAEGESSMRFLDSWSEVESRFAITSGDMADAIKKAASAASNAGINFDQLNGIVASIGAVTRQSGKEVGTSMRFIMRRLSAEKGPEELAKLNIATVTGEGELKGGFDVLGELAMKWKDLGSAQKMAVAQAIGGTRQYNSLLVLMDNWKDALDATHASQNAHGSAQRKNQEIMKTYTKQVEQTKAAFVELQMSVGKVAFPVAKAGLKGMKLMAETVTAIPASFKAAGVAALALFTYLSKGAKILDSISNFFASGAPVAGGLFGSIKEELQTAAGEILGAGMGDDKNRGLKSVIGGKAGMTQGTNMRDFESSLGKAAYLLVTAGKTFNSTVGGAAIGVGGAAQKVGQSTVRGSSWLSSIVDGLGGGDYGKEGKDNITYKDLAGGVADKFGKNAAGETTAIAKTGAGAAKVGGVKAAAKVASKFAAVATEVGGLGTAAGGIFVDKVAEKLGAGGGVFKKWAEGNAGVVQAVAPMLLTIGLLTPVVKSLGEEFVKATKSSQDFEKSMYGVKRADEDALKQIKDLSKGASDIESKMMEAKKLGTPEVAANRKRLGTYRSPLLEMADARGDSKQLGNKLAESNLGLVDGYDKLGNAILRTSSNFKTLMSTFEKSKIKDIAANDVTIAAKHIEALTKTDGSEKWKMELKDLSKEIPVIGEMISSQIDISPAKGIEVVTTQLNKLTAKKNAAPLSTVYDDDIKKLQTKLSKIRTSFEQTYTDFRRSLSDIPTEGLNNDEISRILSAKELQAGYELIIDVEPKFNVAGVKGKAQWQDVLGAEVLKRSFPGIGSKIDATKELTTANLESGGASKRQGKVLSGDIVTFADSAADKFDMAGEQAIVKLKETSDGIFEWVATYFNTKTLRVEERTFDEGMQSLVESVLPTKAIEKDLSDRIASLNTFVAGASAGLVGISKKDFKADFNLGERFFSDVSTSTIIQGETGFDPLAGFGKSDFQAGWGEDFRKYYTEPLNEYKASLEQLEKMRLTGLDSGAIDMSTELYDGIVKLQKILRNNQVVMQYRAVFADLTKTMEANSRALAENMAIEKSRMRLTKETSGLLKGKNASLATIDFGKRSKTDLTAQERLLKDNPAFEAQAMKLRELESKRSGTAESIYSADKAKVALGSIAQLSEGFGSSIAPGDLAKYSETVAKTGDQGIAELKIDTSKTAENTAATVDRLDQILANFEDQAGVDDMSSSFMDALDFMVPSANLTKNERLNEALDRVASIRDDAVNSGDSETVIKANRSLDSLSKQLISRMGIEGAADKADSGLFGAGAFKGDELVQRAFGGLDFKTLASEMKANMPDETDWFGLVSKNGTPDFDKTTANVLRTQKDNKDKVAENSIFSAKNIAATTTGFGVYQAFNSNFSNKKTEAIDKQLTKVRADGGSQADIDSLTAQKTAEEKKARMYGTMRYAAGGAAGSMVLARNMGVSDKNIKRLGAGGAALGVYGAAKMQKGMTGDDLPPIVKDFGKEVTIFAAAMKDDGVFSTLKKGKATKRFKESSEEFMTQFAEETLDLKATPRPNAENRQSKYKAASDSFSKTKEDVKFDAEWKAKEYKRKADNPNANQRENTKESVKAAFEGIKTKVDEVKQSVKQSVKDAAASSAEKMAKGEKVDIKEEASQVFKGAGIKSKEAFDKAKEDLAKASQTAQGAGSVAKESAKGVFDALKEAVNKNTEAVDSNTEKSNGTDSRTQHFGNGGIVKQVVPGVGDVQPAMLSAGERVLTAGQARAHSAGATAAGTVEMSPDSISRLSQAMTSGAALTFAKYAAGKSADKTRIADLNAIGADESADIYSAIMSNTRAAQKVYDTLNADQKPTKDPITAETEEVTKVLDTNKEYMKTVADIDKVTAELNTAYQTQTEEVSKLKEELYALELAEAFKMQLEAIEKSIANAKFGEQIQRSLRTGKGAFAGLSGPRNFDLGESYTADLDPMSLMQLSKQKKADNTNWWNPLDIGDTVFKPIGKAWDRAVAFFDPYDTVNRKFRGQDVMKEYSTLEDEKVGLTSRLGAAVDNRNNASTEDEMEKWEDIIEDTSEKLAEVSKEQEKYTTALLRTFNKMQSAKKVFKNFEAGLNILSSMRLDSMHSLGSQGFGGKLKGVGTNFELAPNNISDLSASQYAVLNAGEDMRDLMNNMTVGTQAHGVMKSNQSETNAELNRSRAQLQQTGSSGVWEKYILGGNDEVKRLKDRIASLNLEYDKQEQAMSTLEQSMVAGSKAVGNFMAVTSASQQLDNALSSLKASFYEVSMGSNQLQDQIDNLYGNSGAEAPVFVDINKRQEAERYGKTLTLGKSNQFDVMEADYMKTWLTSGSGEERMSAMRGMANIPQLKKDYEKDKELKRATADVTRSVDPYREFLSSTARLKVNIDDRVRRNPDEVGADRDRATSANITSVDAQMRVIMERMVSRGQSTPEDFAELNSLKDSLEGSLSKDDKGSLFPAFKQQLTESQKHTVLLANIEKALLATDEEKEAARKVLGIEGGNAPDKRYFAKGGSVGSMVKGPGTGTSDSISTTVQPGSYVIQAKYANKAKGALNAFAAGGQVPIRISNGEMLLSPEEVQAIGGTKAAAALNKGKFASGGFIDPSTMDRSSWSKSDYANYGFAGEKDMMQQTGGLKEPMLSPVDLIPGLGAFKSIKALSKPAAGLTGYLKEAQGIMGMNLDVNKYVKEIQSNKSLHKAVMSRGQEMFGEGTTIAQMAVRSGPINMKGLVDGLERTKGFADGGQVEKSLLQRMADKFLGRKTTDELTEKQKALKEAAGYSKGGDVMEWLRQKGQGAMQSINDAVLGKETVKNLANKQKALDEASNYAGGGTVAKIGNLDIADVSQEDLDRMIYGRAGKPQKEHQARAIREYQDVRLPRKATTHVYDNMFGDAVRKKDPKTGKWSDANLPELTTFGSFDQAKDMIANNYLNSPGKKPGTIAQMSQGLGVSSKTLAEKMVKLNQGGKLKPIITDDQLWRRSQGGYGRTFDAVYGAFNITQEEVEQRLSAISTKKLSEQIKEAAKITTTKVTPDIDAPGPIFTGSGPIFTGAGPIHDGAGLVGATKGPIFSNKGPIFDTESSFPTFASGGYVSRMEALKQEKLVALKKAKRSKYNFEKLKYTQYNDAGKEQERLAKLAELKAEYQGYKSSVSRVNSEMDPLTTGFMKQQMGVTRTVARKGLALPKNKDNSTMYLTGTGSKPMSSMSKGPKIDSFTEFRDRIDLVASKADEKSVRSHLAKKVADWEDLKQDDKDSHVSHFYNSLAKVNKNMSTLTSVGGKSALYNNEDAAAMMNQSKSIFNKELSGFYIKSKTAKAKEMYERINGPGSYEERNKKYGRHFKSRTDMSGIMRNTYGGDQSVSELRDLVERLLAERKAGKSGETITLNNDNNHSNPAKHNGGKIGSTGNYFLQQGEVVLDRGFAEGGLVSSEVATASMSAGGGSIVIEELSNFESIVNKLSDTVSQMGDIKIKDLDKLTDIKIEGIDDLRDIKVEGIDNLRDIKIEGLSDLRDIKVEGIDNLRDIKIEGLDNLRDIKVEGLDNLRDIKIEGLADLRDIRVEGLDNLRDIKIEGLADIRDIRVEGLDQLKDIRILGLEELKDINVNTSSVGADSNDMLAETLKDFDSRVNNLEVSSSGQIDLIKTTVEEAVTGLPELAMVQQSDVAELTRKITETDSGITSVNSSIVSFKQEVSVTIQEIVSQFNSIKTHLYSIKRV